MKFRIAALTLFLGLASSASAYAQGAFLGGFIGASLGSSSGTAVVNPLSMVIYEMPNTQARLKNPMGIRTQVFSEDLKRGAGSKYAGQTLWELFRSVQPEPEKFEVLQVVRIISPKPNDVDSAEVAFWFTYVQKKDVAPPAKK